MLKVNPHPDYPPKDDRYIRFNVEIIMDIFTRIIEILEKGETCCLATIIESDNKDVSLGRKALVLSDGSLLESIGSAQLDSELSIMSQAALRKNKSRTVRIHDKVRVFLNIISAEIKLLVCGAGHIAVSPLLNLPIGWDSV